MRVSFSTDLVRPPDRQAFWAEAICRSFAKVDTKALCPGPVSGRLEAMRIGRVTMARLVTSPQSYSRSARLVSAADCDEFMFDFQIAGRSWMNQFARQGTARPGFGILYDARRPFENGLEGPGNRAEVFMVAVPASALLEALPDAEGLCATPIPLFGLLARSTLSLIRAEVEGQESSACAHCDGVDFVHHLAALLRHASGKAPGLSRLSLFTLIDTHLRCDLGAVQSPPSWAAQFGISERTFDRIFADRGTTFERHLLRRRVERFRELLAQPRLSKTSIANLALECGFADAAHASRTFKAVHLATPRDYRARALSPAADFPRTGGHT